MLPRPASLFHRLKQLFPSSSFDPYLRLGRYDKPVGTQLFFFPAAWGLALASTAWYPSPALFAGFYVSAALVRAAGCAVNDWWDRDFDRKVERCKTRPIASGEINTSQALGFFLLNCSPMAVGYAISPPAAQTAIAVLFPMYCTYPLFKRFTYWPQVMLGFTFNMGTIIAYAMVTGSVNPAVMMLYLGGVAQTVMYDSLYAYQDRDDDVHAGVKSTALRWGENYKEWSALFTGLSAVTWTAAGALAGLDPIYYAAVAGSTAHMVWQFMTINVNDKKDCWNKFASNKYTASILLTGIILAKLRKTWEEKSVKANAGF